jgi:hypothetical protein
MNFHVITTDPFVVKLHGIPFLASNRDRGVELVKRFASFRAIDDTERDYRHENSKTTNEKV